MHAYPLECCLYMFVYTLFQLRDISTVTGDQAELRRKKMDKVVKRLVFLMCAYGVITALTYGPICALQQHSKLLDYHVKKYFGCLMFLPPDHCPKSKSYIWLWLTHSGETCDFNYPPLQAFSQTLKNGRPVDPIFSPVIHVLWNLY